MEQETTFQDSSLPPERALSLPHFEEEATMLSARPVVPLHEVKAKSRSRRHLLLGAALLVAASIGALTASLIYSRGGQTQEDSAAVQDASSPTDNFVSPSGEAMGSAVNSNETADLSEPSDKIVATTRAETKNRDSFNVKKPAVAAPQPRKQPERLASAPIVENRDETRAEEMEMRREQRREARRLRRERRVNGRPGDGSTRIREIFEGSPRP